MPERPLILALDQGTTSSRAVAVDSTGAMIATTQQPFEQLFPDDGWVEHRPDDIWQTTLSSARTVLKQVSEEQLGDVVSLGITNQRETVLIWNRATGQPVCNALVWQDRRTAEVCRDLFERGHQDMIRAKTGLLLDPYFSASKIAWNRYLRNKIFFCKIYYPITKTKPKAKKIMKSLLLLIIIFSCNIRDYILSTTHTG